MSSCTEKTSARSGRLLLGATGILLVCLGVSESSNLDYKAKNSGPQD